MSNNTISNQDNGDDNNTFNQYELNRHGLADIFLLGSPILKLPGQFREW